MSTKIKLTSLYNDLFLKGKVNSKTDFAQQLGVSKQYISNVLSEDNDREPSLKLLRNALRVFQLDEDYFEFRTKTYVVNEPSAIYGNRAPATTINYEAKRLEDENKALKNKIADMKDEIIKLQKHIIDMTFNK